MANGTDRVERRMAFLERICQEDRERWKRNDLRLGKLYRLIMEGFRRSDRRFEEHKRRLDSHDSRIDAALKAIHRFLQR